MFSQRRLRQEPVCNVRARGETWATIERVGCEAPETEAMFA